MGFKLLESLTYLSKREKILLLGLMLMMGCLSIVYVGLPLWFNQPEFVCLNDETGKYEKCSYDQACANEDKMKLDPDYKTNDINTYFRLYCSRLHVKSEVQSILIVGSWIGCCFNVFIGVGKSKRRQFFSIIAFLYCLAILGSLSTSSAHMWAIFMSITYFAYNSCYSNIIAVLSENFPQEQKKYFFIFIWESYTLVGLLASNIAYQTNSNWRAINITYLITMAASAIFLSQGRFSLEEDGLLRKKKDENSWKGIERVWKNVLVFCLVWIFNFGTKIGISMELGNMGSVYFNVMAYSIIEGICAISGGYLAHSGNPLKLIKFFAFMLAITGSIFWTYSHENAYFYAMLALLMKFFIEMLYDVLFVAITDFVPPSLITRFLSLAQFISRIPNMAYPYFVAYVKHDLDLHPFVFIGLGYVLVIFLLSFIRKIEEQTDSKALSFSHSDLVVYSEVNVDDDLDEDDYELEEEIELKNDNELRENLLQNAKKIKK